MLSASSADQAGGGAARLWFPMRVTFAINGLFSATQQHRCHSPIQGFPLTLGCQPTRPSGRPARLGRIPGKTLIRSAGPTASVAGVNRPEPPALCFLVEWYRNDLATTEPDDIAAQLDRGAAAVSAEGAAVRFLLTVAAPTDDVLYGVYAADSADAVLVACRQAGWPPDRITADIHTHVSRAG